MIKILGIETSCDETAVAIVSSNKRILANQLISQIDEHSLYGGVVPEVASRAHMRNLDFLVDEALKKSRCSLEELDGISVTAGPGLVGGVIVGVTYAKSIGAALNKPVIPINHLEGHALTARLTCDLEFPFLLLLVSGGHTQLLLVKGVGQYFQIGTTLDDAVGEAFDKCAKMLGLSYPGGPSIEKSAVCGDAFRFDLPRPLCKQNNCNFSFSGLKTAILRLVQENENLSDSFVRDTSASFQRTVSEILAMKTKIAMSRFLEKFPGSQRRFVIAGGVASNSSIRDILSRLCADEGFQLFVPPVKLCTDNAVMISWAGIERFNMGNYKDFDFEPRSRWPLSEVM